MKVKTTTDNVAAVLRAIAKLQKMDVLVGVPDGAPCRSDSALSNAEIGYLLEHGVPELNIPPRPHLAAGVGDAQNNYMPYLKKAASSALGANTEDAIKALNAAGMEAQSGVVEKILDGACAPLTESTLAARRRRGRTGIKPLNDTGQYRQSITYVVRKK